MTFAIPLPPVVSGYYRDSGYQATLNAARHLRWHGLSAVPGILQTGAYTHALLSAPAMYPQYTEEDREEYVKHRTGLLRHFTASESSGRLEVVLTEASLHRRVGNAHLMREQRQHLVEVSGSASVQLRIIQLTAGPYAGQSNDFAVADTGTVSMGMINDDDMGRVVADPGELAIMVRHFEAAQSVALSPEDSRELLQGLLDAPVNTT